LGGKREVQALEQQLELGLRLCVACEQKFSTVGGRYFHIDHLHGRKLEDRADRESAKFG
jgi:hypothetical protein